jgi:hypothetical protein
VKFSRDLNKAYYLCVIDFIVYVFHSFFCLIILFFVGIHHFIFLVVVSERSIVFLLQFHVTDSFHLIDRQDEPLKEAEYSILISIISIDASLVVFFFSNKKIFVRKKCLRSIWLNSMMFFKCREGCLPLELILK